MAGKLLFGPPVIRGCSGKISAEENGLILEEVRHIAGLLPRPRPAGAIYYG